jgi:chromosome segregation ATPase
VASDFLLPFEMALDLSLSDLLNLRGEIDQLINHRNLKTAAKTEIQRLKDERRERLEDLSGLTTVVYNANQSVREADAHLQRLMEEKRRAQGEKEDMEKIVEALDGVIGGKEEELAAQEKLCDTTFARFKQAFASPAATQVGIS